MRTGATCATEDGHFLNRIENLCKPYDFFFRWADPCLGLFKRYEWSVGNGFFQCNVSRENDNRNSMKRNCSSHCNLKYTWNLLRMRNHLTILATLSEQKLWMSLLKICTSNFQDRHPVAIAIV